MRLLRRRGPLTLSRAAVELPGFVSLQRAFRACLQCHGAALQKASAQCIGLEKQPGDKLQANQAWSKPSTRRSSRPNGSSPGAARYYHRSGEQREHCRHGAGRRLGAVEPLPDLSDLFACMTDATASLQRQVAQSSLSALVCGTHTLHSPAKCQ